MPQYKLKCTDEKCGHISERICSYDSAKEMLCEKCSAHMMIMPVASIGIVHGFSAANGYHRETIDYAKGPIG
jgi:predicted nucleic acid-binding Zn ribbon protein